MLCMHAHKLNLIHRVQAVIILFSRILDVCNFNELFKDLTEPEQKELYHRYFNQVHFALNNSHDTKTIAAASTVITQCTLHSASSKYQ
jgi:hypothetical protein